ncbi:DUF485 domain-containing protein [Corynebacterium hansenii]|uniref:DUF485 domain-containing protein n=1 Tax=Corynebacterium hansenii TaxID=394964 RepID=A0ABV7ZNZ2_9CORY|nr:DUF485 domain-containing protein [Corynebacterium hansenii]WJZ00863.1 hypothetical protein CHAN_11330 [Corynebacterium hansenii]
MSATPKPVNRHKPTAAEYRYVQGTEEFQELRTTFRSFTIPLTIAGLVWYVGYVLLATYMPDLFGTEMPIVGNLGILLGLLQFVTTFFITWWYIGFANKKLEPKQAAIREEMESGAIAEKLGTATKEVK